MAKVERLESAGAAECRRLDGMAMGKKPAARQRSSMWVTTADLPKSAGHPFFEQLNRILEDAGFDAFVEGLCAVFYASRLGRPSLRPGRYFRLLFIGYFEGLSSERGIAWRVADSLSLRDFLDFGRHRGDAEPFDAVTHAASDRRGNARGGVHVGAGTVGGSGSGAGEDGRRRCDDAGSERGASNKEWKSPQDPDAKIAKMKDGRTHLAHKAEHGVDLETGAILSVTVQDASEGDTATLPETLTMAAEQVEAVQPDGEGVQEMVADKGYHSDATLLALDDVVDFDSAAAVGTRRRGRGPVRLVHLRRARAASLPAVACTGPPAGAPAASLPPVLGEGRGLAAAGTTRLVELLLEVFATTLPSVPVADGARQVIGQLLVLALKLLDALVLRIPLGPTRLRTTAFPHHARHTSGIGTCAPNLHTTSRIFSSIPGKQRPYCVLFRAGLSFMSAGCRRLHGGRSECQTTQMILVSP